jgi:hypothetical protein
VRGSEFNCFYYEHTQYRIAWLISLSLGREFRDACTEYKLEAQRRVPTYRSRHSCGVSAAPAVHHSREISEGLLRDPEARDDHLAAFLVEVRRIRVPAAEGESIQKAGSATCNPLARERRTATML